MTTNRTTQLDVTTTVHDAPALPAWELWIMPVNSNTQYAYWGALSSLDNARSTAWDLQDEGQDVKIVGPDGRTYSA